MIKLPLPLTAAVVMPTPFEPLVPFEPAGPVAPAAPVSPLIPWAPCGPTTRPASTVELSDLTINNRPKLFTLADVIDKPAGHCSPV